MVYCKASLVNFANNIIWGEHLYKQPSMDHIIEIKELLRAEPCPFYLCCKGEKFVIANATQTSSRLFHYTQRIEINTNDINREEFKPLHLLIFLLGQNKAFCKFNVWTRNRPLAAVELCNSRPSGLTVYSLPKQKQRRSENFISLILLDHNHSKEI